MLLVCAYSVIPSQDHVEKKKKIVMSVTAPNFQITTPKLREIHQVNCKVYFYDMRGIAPKRLFYRLKF
jgi:hypothetical protein